MIIEITKNNQEELQDSFLSLEIIDDFIKNPFAKILLLKEKDEIIGFLYYSDIYERAEINQFEIKEIHRNCGKGQLLLDYFIHHIKKDITLEVKKDNISAIHLYEKNGFEQKAIRMGYYNGIDGLLMERKNKKDA